MVEQKVLKFFLDPTIYEKWSKSVKNSFITPEAKELFNLIPHFIEAFPLVTSFTMRDVCEWEILRKPAMKEEKREVYKTIAHAVDSITEPVDQSILNVLALRDMAGALVFESERVVAGEVDTHELIKTLIEEYEDLTGISHDEKEMWVDTPGGSLFDPTTLTAGLHWRLTFLNEALGALQKGNLVIVSARPETGKTSFLASEATFMNEQLEEDEKVFWFCNEEPGENIKRRIITAHLNKDAIHVAHNLSKFTADMNDLDLGFRIAHKGRMSIKDIEKALRGQKPGLIIIDQLRKLDSPWNAAQEHLRLQKLYEWARQIAADHAPVLAVHQTGATGEGVLYLGMEHLHGSKTDVQGEADAIIMIGRENTPSMDALRGISIPKNKMIGNNPLKRHGREVVTIITDTGRYHD
jgi:replicative DNA helicase